MTLTLPLWFASHGTEEHKETGSPSWEGAKSTGLSQASITWNPNNSKFLYTERRPVKREKKERKKNKCRPHPLSHSPTTTGMFLKSHTDTQTKANNPVFLPTLVHIHQVSPLLSSSLLTWHSFVMQLLIIPSRQERVGCERHDEFKRGVQVLVASKYYGAGVWSFGHFTSCILGCFCPSADIWRILIRTSCVN